MKITKLEENRIKHSYMVGKLMEAIAEQMPNKFTHPEEMFLLGYLHDIGYKWDEKKHNIVGGDASALVEFKYDREILAHSDYDIPYFSEELDLLRYCDMHIDGEGNYVNLEKRIKDWYTRHDKKEMDEWVKKSRPLWNKLEKKFNKVAKKVIEQSKRKRKKNK